MSLAESHEAPRPRTAVTTSVEIRNQKGDVLRKGRRTIGARFVDGKMEITYIDLRGKTRVIRGDKIYAVVSSGHGV